MRVPYLLLSVLLPAVAMADAATLTVVLDGVRVERGGVVRCALWSGAEGWPGDGRRAAAHQEVTPATGRCVFPGVVSGRWAVSVMHDEDGDGRLATNALGVPREGWATSGDLRPLFRGPTFEEAAVDLRGDTTLRLALRYGGAR